MRRHAGAVKARGVVVALAVGMAGALLLTSSGLLSAGLQDANRAAIEGEGGIPDAYATAHFHDPVQQAAEDLRLRALCESPARVATDSAHCPRPAPATLRVARTLAAAPPPASAAGAQLAATAGPPADVGAWSPPVDLDADLVAVHAIQLPTGRILMFGPSPPAEQNQAFAVVLDPATGERTQVNPPVDPVSGHPYNIWCAGQALLPDGTVLVAGGTLAYPPDQVHWKGLDRLFTFNPYTLEWTEQPKFQHGRWYPTVTVLADGRAVIFGGYDEYGASPITYNNQIAVFTPNPTDRDGLGTLVELDRSRESSLYDTAALLPDGNILYSGPRPQDAAILNTGTFRFTDLPNADHPQRYWGSMILDNEGPGQNTMRLIGGADLQLQATEARDQIIDLDHAADAPVWGPALDVPRAHLNTVILPTGQILAVGGGLGQDTNANNYMGAVFQSEMLEPSTASWRPVASQTRQRTYHSVAVLLPDGRVISAGDDRRAGDIGPIGTRGDDTYEIYSPPYLFTGTPRPVITSAPASVDHGADITVESPDAGTVTRAVLIAPGAVTHSNNMNQRSITLPFTRSGDTLTLRAPAGPTLAPPGQYMLFLVDAHGVPSMAEIVALGTAAGPVVPDAATGGRGPAAAVGGGPAGTTAGAGAGAGGGGGPAPACQGHRATIVGTPARDLIRGTPRRDVIAGLGGNDLIRGLAGDDLICGGPGDDRLVAGAGADRVTGAAGRDVLTGGPGSDVLAGGAGADRIMGDAGRDRLEGGPGVDLLSGGPAGDLLHGGVGADRIIGGPGTDRLLGPHRGDRVVGLVSLAPPPGPPASGSG